MPAITELTKIAEGREAEIFAWSDGRVVRLFRDAAAASWMQREVDAMRAVRSVVPLVPEIYETIELDGRPGIIMQRIDGPDLLSRIASKPWTVRGGGTMLGELHAQLHSIAAPSSIESLPERARRRLVPRSPDVPPEILAWGLRRLDAMSNGDRLLHGDFHPGNVLLSPEGAFVIDWPNVTRGDPDADVARTVLMLRVGSVPPGAPFIVKQGARFVRSLLVSAYLRSYRRHRRADIAAIERWVPLRAVDRLTEKIPEERAALLAMIRRAMADEAS